MEKMSFYLFSGKGGVGKTTCACAQALRLALGNKRTLLFSTDPAHSLADCFQVSPSSRIQPVPHVPNLYLYEINAEEVYREFSEMYFAEIREIVSSCTYLDEEDVDHILSQTLPGLDELMGLKTVMDFVDSKDFDAYVWDTAPTGHTLRLLSLPSIANEWVKAIATIKWKYIEVMASIFPQQFNEDNTLLKIKMLIKKVNAVLKDSRRCSVTLVTIPTVMSVQESKRMAIQLRQSDITLSRVIVNNVHPANKSCVHCRQKYEYQQTVLNEIKNVFYGTKIITIENQPGEIRGVDGLKRIVETF